MISRTKYFRAAVLAGFAVMQHPASSSADPVPMRVAVPVADVRSEMKDAAPDTHANDPLEETQILFGERVRVHERRDGWARVECPEQREYTHKNSWEGYPGWVRETALEPMDGVHPVFRGAVHRPWADIRQKPSSAAPVVIRVPFGSRIDVLSDPNLCWYRVRASGGSVGWMRVRDVRPAWRNPPEYILRTDVWTHVRRFLGTPYYWGGLSAHAREYRTSFTGVDCSGLIHLAYRAAGVNLPRDSHEQWMTSAPVRRADLARGDLVFLANAAKPTKIVHVMMYVGGEFLIEGPGTGMNVRRVTFQKKLGQRLSRIESGDTVGPKVVYFGRPDPVKLNDAGTAFFHLMFR